MSPGMLSNPSALFLYMSCWADAIGADGQRIRFCYYCPAWVSLRMKIEGSSDRCGALRDFGVFYFRRVWNYHMTGSWTLNRCLWERRGWCWTVWSGHNCAVLILHKRRGSSHVIKLLKRAWQHVLLQSVWKININTTDIWTARHLLSWWTSHYKVCFSYTSGNKTF